MSRKPSFGHVPDSVWEDFEELQKELNVGDKSGGKRPSPSSVSFDDSSWEFVLDPELRHSVESVLSEKESKKESPEILVSHFDEFFSPTDELSSSDKSSFDNNDISKHLFEISAKSARRKVFECIALGFGISSLDNEKNLSLSDAERDALSKILGLPLLEGVTYSDEQLLLASKSMIMMKLKISDARNYSMKDIFSFAKTADSFFSPYLDDIFEGFETSNIFYIFNIVDKPIYSADTALSFSLMKPSDRLIWIVSKFPLFQNVRFQMISFLGLNDTQKYSIEDIKTIADFYDTNGRKGSGILRTAGHLGFDVNLVYKKKYSVDEVLKFVLLPQKGRNLWLELQK
ncbi:MAG: hypothetical protein RBS56_02580 [Candidatus Gracilibacteria bacterium]|jgi:hypothetical protein|nr:hypothetical protein [Candidatus Gracilibacteria bacterium]